MKPVPVILPQHCAQRVGAEIATRIVGAGETALLAEPLLGLIASRECPGLWGRISFFRMQKN